MHLWEEQHRCSYLHLGGHHLMWNSMKTWSDSVAACGANGNSRIAAIRTREELMGVIEIMKKCEEYDILISIPLGY